MSNTTEQPFSTLTSSLSICFLANFSCMFALSPSKDSLGASIFEPGTIDNRAPCIIVSTATVFRSRGAVGQQRGVSRENASVYFWLSQMIGAEKCIEVERKFAYEFLKFSYVQYVVELISCCVGQMHKFLHEVFAAGQDRERVVRSRM